MHIEEKVAVANLTNMRRQLKDQLRPELPEAERARRVAEYARQIAAYGHIVAWLPPAEARTCGYRSRFAGGDALRPR